MSKAFQKVKFYQNLTSGSVSKQRFSVLKEKAVSDQYFLSYVKKTTGPPPAGIGLRRRILFFLFICPVSFLYK